ncbi:hypothetical protein B0H17DRAFT_1186443, partial [Mycena rosella]
MHSALALKHLTKLPTALRKRAMAAAGGDTEELRALTAVKPSTTNASHILPLYYAGLDDSAIPSLVAQLDCSEDLPLLTRRLSRIVLCLQGLLLLDSKDSLPGPSSVWPHIWRRVWPWLDFLNIHRDTLPQLPNISYIHPLSLVNVLGKNEETAKLIHLTPGFRILAFRFWTLSFDQTHLVSIQGAFEVFCVYMQNCLLTITEDHDFEEAIEGSGGSRTSLARLLVNHVKCAVQSTVISPGVFSMRGVIGLLQARCDMDASFRKILIDEGIVAVFTAAACRFASPPFSAHDNLFNVSFAIKYYLRTAFGHKIVTQAVRSGLLRALLTWGRMIPPKPQSLQQLDDILTILSGSFVYLSVLLQLKTSIDELDIPIDGHTFRGFPVSDRWEALWSLLESRWALMKVYMAREEPSVKSACNNVACSIIRPRSEFQCCSACRESRYCSRACQIHDWRRGGHREMCGWSLDDNADSATKRDRSFLRVLLHEDYLKLQNRILRDQLAFLRSSPGTAFYVKFDYCTPYGDCAASVEAASAFPLDNVMWQHEIARARESGGRLQTHVMRLADGGCDAVWVFSLCAAKAERTR